MKKKKIAVLLTVCTFLAAVPGPAFGALSDYDAETAARLQDNKMEYDELENLIREYNPQMKYSFKQLELSEDETATTVREMRDYLDENGIKDALKGLKESKKQMEAMPDSDMKAELLATVDQGILGYQTMLDMPSTTSKSTDKSLEKVKKQLNTGIRQMAVGAKTMMIMYDNLTAQLRTLEKVEELQKQSVEAAKLQVQLDMVTDVSVYQAESSLLSTQNMLENLRSSADTLRSQLCLMTGWPADGTPEIGPVPAPDINRVAAIDFQADLGKAIGNNQSLITMRRSSGSKSTSGRNLRNMTIEEAEQKLSIEMQRLYAAVQQKKLAYDAAGIAFEKARLAQDAAARQYGMKMISHLQYLGAEVSYYQAEGAKKTADTELLQALLNYDAAVDGFVTIPE